jgi:hypothetical protein
VTRTTIWTILGIEATRETAAIRRAYAARLKAVHPEDDPEGFKALRAAYEHALAMAAAPERPVVMTVDEAADALATEDHTAAGPADIVDTGDDEIPKQSPPPAFSPPVSPSRAQREPAKIADRPQAPEHVQAIQRLAALLSAEDEPGASALNEEVEKALAASGFISAHIESERALAHLAAQYSPRSDPFIGTIVDHFGWGTTRIDDPDLQQTAGYCIQRRRDLDFLEKTRRKGAPMHRALPLLKRAPKYAIFKGMLRPGLLGDVRSLLTVIRTSHPTLRHEFPEYALKAWAKYFSSQFLNPIAAWILIAFVGAIVVLSIVGENARTNFTLDVNPAVVAMSGFNADSSQTETASNQVVHIVCGVWNSNEFRKCAIPSSLPKGVDSDELMHVAQVTNNTRIPIGLLTSVVPDGTQFSVAIDLPEFRKYVERSSGTDAQVDGQSDAVSLILRKPADHRVLVLDCAVSLELDLSNCRVLALRPSAQGFQQSAIVAAEKSKGPVGYPIRETSEGRRMLFPVDLGPASDSSLPMPVVVGQGGDAGATTASSTLATGHVLDPRYSWGEGTPVVIVRCGVGAGSILHDCTVVNELKGAEGMGLAAVASANGARAPFDAPTGPERIALPVGFDRRN